MLSCHDHTQRIGNFGIAINPNPESSLCVDFFELQIAGYFRTQMEVNSHLFDVISRGGYGLGKMASTLAIRVQRTEFQWVGNGSCERF